MRYEKYITKRRMKTRAICGDINIPHGTICEVSGGFIYHGTEKICAVKSQQAKDYFWGYDAENPVGEIRRQETALQLWNMAPSDSVENLITPGNQWRQYGQLVSLGGNRYRWQWVESVLDLPELALKAMINKLEG